MRVEQRYALPLSVAEAVSVHRDHLGDFAPDLPGVATIREVARREDGHELCVDADWQGDLTVLPLVLRWFVPAHLFRWHSKTRWTGDQVRWSMEVPILGPAVELQGIHHFLPSPEGCQVEVEATFDFRAEAGPAALASAAVLPVLERFVGGLFLSLMRSSGVAVTRWVRQEKRRAA